MHTLKQNQWNNLYNANFAWHADHTQSVQKTIFILITWRLLFSSPSRWPCCTVFTGPVKYGWYCIWLQLKSPWFKSNGRSKSGTDNNTKSSKCWSKSLENFVFFHSSDSAPAFLALPQLIHHNLFRWRSSSIVTAKGITSHRHCSLK